MALDLRQGELATDDKDIIQECRERFSYSAEAEGRNRKEFEFDKRFVNGDQWDPTIRDERFSDRRPCLTVNITDAVCRRIVNACRENRPRIVVHPVGNGADVGVAKVISGLIRHIEYRSNAAHAYDSAVENAIHGGWGWLGVDTEWAREDSFDQELTVSAWPNPLMCYADPNSIEPDGSDMQYFLETSLMRRTEYRARYGKIDQNGWQWVGAGDNVPDWSNKEEIRLAKYWRVEIEPATLYQFTDGQQLMVGWKVPAGMKVLREREVYRRKIKRYLLTTFKVLKEDEWPGKWIPRVPVYGRRMDLNGKVEIKGMVRDLRDTARIYNYARTAETEYYAMQPKAWIMGPEGFMDGHEAAWRDTNRKPIVALEYKIQTADNGQILPPPERFAPPPVNQGFMEWGQGTKSDFLAVSGMSHDPGQDKEGEVVSGVALKRRQGIADVSNFDFYDNLTRSICQIGRILVDLIPHYYSTERMARIIREDGTAEQVTLNEGSAQRGQMDPMTGAMMQVKNDVTVGDYEVIVDTGPSYQTKREESAASMLELLGTPAGEMVAKSAADLMVRAMDFPNSDMVADRLMAMIPAAQMDNVKGMAPDQLKAMVAGLQQQLANANKQQLALQLELQAKHGLEQMRQSGETQRLQLREQAATQREEMKVRAQVHDTHVDAVTRHDVAEIAAAGKMMDTAATHRHEGAMFDRQAEHELKLGEREPKAE